MARRKKYKEGTIGARLQQLQKITPKGPTQYAQLYRDAEDLKRKYDRITFWTIFQSDEQTHLVRPHVFIAKKASRSPQEWYEWLARNLDDIQQKHVLRGLNDRSGITYYVFKKLGWVGHARKLVGTAAVGRRWRPAKPQGKPSE